MAVKNSWYQQSERGVGAGRLEILFWIYKIFGIRFIKFCVGIISGMIGAMARPARQFSTEYRTILNEYQVAHNIRLTRFSSFTHIRTFANSLVDKMVANCDKKNRIQFSVVKNEDWHELQGLIDSRRGAFLICNHVGNIEALAAFPDKNDIIMHAFMQVTQSGIFHRFITKHSVRQNTIIHAVEDMNMATATEMYDCLNSGHLVMMAGDRVSVGTPGKTIRVQILGCDCELPMGVFRFAKSMSHPVFAVSLLNQGREKYELIVQKLNNHSTDKMASEFAEFLEKSILIAPTQWFNFYKFFK